ncbi:unnamed protein product [Merluccius merluccius]
MGDVCPAPGASQSPGERARMERSLGADGQTEESEGGLRELVLRWFTETQETKLMLHNGNFPTWFRGFTARKDAEDLLRDKTMGCFLIRLSEKIRGYILSYKGQDRCRHFVINQNDAGLFVLEGDCQSHHSLTELIAYYKFSPIQPFGEYLTSCCSESNPSELYDVVRFETQEKSGKVTCLTYSLHSPGMQPHGLIDHQTDHHDVLRPNPLYQASEELDETPAQDKDNLYTEVSERHSLPTPCSDDNPYELIEASQMNHYEKLEEMKSKNSKSTIMGKTVCMKIRSD